MLKIPVFVWIRTLAALLVRHVRCRGFNLAAAYLVLLIVLTITILPASASSPIGHWSFDQETGTTVTDFSGNENTGTLINGPVWSGGKFGYGLSFNGVDQYIEIAHSDSLNLRKELTISTWIYNQATANSLLSDPEYHIIASKGWAPDSGGSWTLAWDKKANDLSFCVRKSSNRGYNCVFFNYGTLTNDWHLVTAVFNNGRIRLYVDGLLVAGPTALGTSTINSNTDAVRIGAVLEQPSKFLQNWDGRIDEVQIYNEALSNAEIKALFQESASQTSSGSPSTTSNSLSQTSAAGPSNSNKPPVATPVITPNGGTFSSPVTVVLNSTTPAAFIYYTTNGLVPTESSTLYKGPFTIASNTWVKAKVFKNNSSASSEASAWFGMDQQFDFSLSNSGDKAAKKGSSAQNSVSAALKSGNSKPISYSVSGLPSGASSSFSTTSCNPTCSTVLTLSTSTSTPTGTFPITVTGSDGPMARSTSFNLTVSDLPTVATPTISPNGGSYTGSVSVTMTTATAGAAIRYTTNGTIPTQSSTLYTGAMTLASSATVKAAAFMTNYNPSGVASASFTVTRPFDFSLSNSSNGNQSVTAGSSASNTITATLASGLPQAVTFSASGLPSGTTASFSSNSCSPSCSSVLTLNVSNSTAAGTYGIMVTASGGGAMRTTAFNLTVSSVAPSVSVNKTSYAAGETITVTVNAGSSNVQEWIAMYVASNPDSAWSFEGNWQYLNSQQIAPATPVSYPVTLSFIAPSIAGTYNIRYFAYNGYSNRLALSQNFVVTGPTTIPSVSLNKSSYTAGETITVTVNAGSSNVQEWIALYGASNPDSAWSFEGNWQYLNGQQIAPATPVSYPVTLSFVAPSTAGNYNIRYFAYNGYSNRLAQSQNFAVIIPPGTIYLTWTDTSDSEEGFILERLVNGVVEKTFEIASNTISYTDSGLVFGTTYCYQVRAFNAMGISDPSNISCSIPAAPVSAN